MVGSNSSRTEPPPQESPTTPPTVARLARVFGPVTLIYLALLALGFATRDFGHHPDDRFQLQAARRTVESGVPLPSWYRYPSICYWITLGVLAPTAVATGGDAQALRERIDSKGFRLDLRMVFFALSYLTLFAVAGLAARATRSPPTAVLAALLLGLGFEFHYHARWVRPDTLMALFVILGVWAAVAHLESGSRRTWIAAAVLAGLAAGTKYPGGLVLLPLGLAILFRNPRAPRTWMLSGLGALAVCLSTFVLTTPGALLENEIFVKHIRAELRHYGERGHPPYSIEPGWEHLSSILVYYGQVALSHQRVVAGVLFALAVFGGAALVRRLGRAGWLIVSLPVVYTLYFSTQAVMTVRNLQLVVPFLCLFAATGIAACTGLLPARAGRPTRQARGWFWVPVGAALAFNAGWLVYADWTIWSRPSYDVTAAAVAFAEAAPEPVFLGRGLRADVGEPSLAPLVAAGRVVATPESAEQVVMYPHDARIGAPGRFVANRPGVYRLLPRGPYDVNWDYYPSWGADTEWPEFTRPILISGEYFRALAEPE